MRESPLTDEGLREHQKKRAKSLIGAAPSRQADWQRLRNFAQKLASPQCNLRDRDQLLLLAAWWPLKGPADDGKVNDVYGTF